MRDHWKAVHRRAVMEARLALGLESRAKIMIRVMGAVVILAALFFWGSEDSWKDESVVRLALMAIVMFSCPIVYLWKIAEVPAKMAAEEKAEKDKLEERLSRAKLQISHGWASPYKHFTHRGITGHRIAIHNTGRSTAQNVKVWLKSVAPLPKAHIRSDFPFPVAKAGQEWIDRRLNVEATTINPDESELFELARSWRIDAWGLLVGWLDTKPDGDSFPWRIDAEETWELIYEVTAANADALRFQIMLSVKDERVALKLTNDGQPTP
jgi:hypothetical protein